MSNCPLHIIQYQCICTLHRIYITQYICPLHSISIIVCIIITILLLFTRQKKTGQSGWVPDPHHSQCSGQQLHTCYRLTSIIPSTQGWQECHALQWQYWWWCHHQWYGDQWCCGWWCGHQWCQVTQEEGCHHRLLLPCQV